MIDGLILVILFKYTIKVNAVKFPVPCADNADATVGKSVSEGVQVIIILIRN